MAIHSDGSYNVPNGIVFSYPVICKNGTYEIVQGLKINEEGQRRFDITIKELLSEREAVEDLLV